jgi:glutathione peroxidase
MADSIFALSARANHGGDLQLGDFAGKVLLVVNTASRCGFTPQYEGLELLFRKYKDAGLVVLGFPCGQFAHQEPGDDQQIAQFCQVNFGVTFPLMSKIEVNGPGTHPVFRFLKARASGWLGARVKWNFTKFLVQRDGQRVKRYAPFTKPEKLERDIQAALGQGPPPA